MSLWDKLKPPYFWSSACVLGIVIFFIFRKRATTSRLLLPPGPKGLPFLRNIFDIPRSLEYLTYTNWVKSYGDVIYMSAVGRDIIILNSIKAANDLLERRSANYSDRPYLPMMHDEDLMDFNYAFGIKRYTRSWKLHRRLFTQHINSTTVPKLFGNKQVSATYQLLHELLSNPPNLLETLSHTSASVVLGITYGYDVQSKADPLVKMATEVIRLGPMGASPKFLVNIFPAFKKFAWLPGVTFKRFADHVRNLHQQISQTAFDGAKKRLDLGEYTPSFLQSALAELRDGDDPEMLQSIKDVASQMYGAGVDTTVATLHNIILQLILHPSMQRLAHNELDTIIGSPSSPTFRFPTFHDRPALVYLEAVMKEGLRWSPAVPLGLPQATLQEDQYRGWRIPKGVILIPNLWGMQRDASVYSHPDKFDPERFMEREGKPAEPDPMATFGFGRRVCPGRHLAESMVWIELACILAAFHIEPPLDEHGQPLDLRWAEELVPGEVLHYQPYTCIFKPRSESVATMIREFRLHAM